MTGMVERAQVVLTGALAGVLAKHVYPGELRYALGDAWFNCSCGERITVPVVDLRVQSTDVLQAHNFHVAAALAAALNEAAS